MINKTTESYNDKIAKLFNNLNGETGICRQLTFQVTEDCTLRCSYCYQGVKRKNIMPFEIAKKTIDMFLNNSDKIKTYFNTDTFSAVILDFIGGEPTLEIELIDNICSYFVEQAFLKKSKFAYRFMISISSNGTLYFTEPVQNFIKKWKDNLSLTITLDGCKELHDSCRCFSDGSGSYDLVCSAALDYMKNFDSSTSTKLTISPDNISYLIEALNNLVDLGYTQIFANCVYEEGWTIEHAKLLYKELKQIADSYLSIENPPNLSLFNELIGTPMDKNDNRNWCGGTGLMLSVDYKGDFYPCIRYMENALCGEQEPYSIGNVIDGICTTKDTKEKLDYLVNITRQSQSTEECWNCPVAQGCSWCSAYNYQKTGDPNKRVTYICIMHKARVLANVYYWNKYYKKYNIKKLFKLYLSDEEALKIISKEELDILKQLSIGK